MSGVSEDVGKADTDGLQTAGDVQFAGNVSAAGNIARQPLTPRRHFA